ncbi:hypothetical protein [Idiomarina aminovorans]|uniref:hypothetical protein n=1 Tax=Idiomarina aminovorans TaxID=2914829 RepID=UPI002004C878|nr:hypothetical protein [Idiomarina sp. ATCH4]MCK7460199.1 hypothetical protein [Idiomarina sp. ATCH4]
MKFFYIVSIGISLGLLGGCGQNIEKIKSDIHSSNNIESELEFEGYVATVDKDDVKAAKAFRRENNISSFIVNSDGSLKPLPQPSYTPDSYAAVEEAYESIKDTLVMIDKEVEQEAKEITASHQRDKERYKSVLKELQSKLSDYNKRISKEQSAYDAATEKLNTFKNMKKEAQEKFSKDLREIIIEDELAIDVNRRFKLYNQYDVYFGARAVQRARDKNESNKKLALIGKESKVDSSERCLVVKESIGNEKLIAAVIKYGLLYENADYEMDHLDDELDSVKSELRRAKIIAKNQTGIDANSIQKEISRLEKRIERSDYLAKSDSNIDRLKRSAVKSHSLLMSAKNQFDSAVENYMKDVHAEALSLIDISLDSFDDENDSYSLDDDEYGLAFYILKAEGRSNIVHVAKLSGNSSQRSFYQVFRQSEDVSNRFKINGPADIEEMLKQQTL